MLKDISLAEGAEHIADWIESVCYTPNVSHVNFMANGEEGWKSTHPHKVSAKRIVVNAPSGLGRCQRHRRDFTPGQRTWGHQRQACRQRHPH